MNTIKEVIEDLKMGKMVIIMDDENRENEGDLIIAAEAVTAKDINFMAMQGRGLICLTLTEERCHQLGLPLMVDANGCQHSTNFTVSIDYAGKTCNGITAAARAKTIQTAIQKDAKVTDIVQPGNIFPLMAKPGGVLSRSGHTEAGCDLARLAGYEPSAVIVEILNEDGTMARRPQLEEFAQSNGLKIGTIADLINYRVSQEQIMFKVSSDCSTTEFGEISVDVYKDNISGELHSVLVCGSFDKNDVVPVYVHEINPVFDFLGLGNDDLGCTQKSILQQLSAEGKGIILLRHKRTKPDPDDSLELGMISQLLNQYDVRKIRLLGADCSHVDFDCLKKSGDIEIVGKMSGIEGLVLERYRKNSLFFIQ